jgi:hypothetical protein
MVSRMRVDLSKMIPTEVIVLKCKPRDPNCQHCHGISDGLKCPYCMVVFQ